MNIELRQELGAKGAYNEGKPIRGHREIWIDGELRGYVKMRGRGCHGVEYDFYDANNQGLSLRKKDGTLSHYSQESVSGRRLRGWAAAYDKDNRSTEERIVDKARDLARDGRFPSKTERDALSAQIRLRADQRDAEDRAHRALMKGALLDLWGRDRLTNSEREGLAAAYAEIFDADIVEHFNSRGTA